MVVLKSHWLEGSLQPSFVGTGTVFEEIARTSHSKKSRFKTIAYFYPPFIPKTVRHASAPFPLFLSFYNK